MLVVLAGFFALGMVYTSFQQRLYLSTTEVMVRQSQDVSNNLTSILPGVGNLSSLAMNGSIDNQVRLLSSSDFISSTFAGLPETIRRGTSFSNIGVKVSNEVTNGINSNVISIAVTGTSPQIATAMANGMVDAFIVSDREESHKTTSTALGYVEREMNRVGQELQQARQDLVEFQLQHDIPAGSNNTQLTAVGEDMEKLVDDKRQDEADLATAQETMRSLESRMSATDMAIIDSGDVEAKNAEIERMNSQITDLESSRANLLLEYVPDAPEVKKVEAQIQGAMDQRSAYLNALTKLWLLMRTQRCMGNCSSSISPRARR